MIQKYTYGTPFETDAIVTSIPASEGTPAYGTISTESGFSFTYDMDDCSGEVLGFVMERLMKAGARDVHYVPVFMKKNRPAWVLNVICKEEDMEMLQNIIFEETTTIGIRYSRMERTILPRETRTLPTPWGEVQVKVCTLNGKEQLYPEYESVAQLSREKEIPFTEIYRYIVLANKDKE